MDAINKCFIDHIIERQVGYPTYTEDTVSMFIDGLMNYKNMNITQREIFDTIINECVDLDYIAYKLNKINDDCKGEK